MDLAWLSSGDDKHFIAAFTEGTLLPVSEYRGRVHHTTNAGIQLDRLTEADTGNYSVELLVKTAAGEIASLASFVFVRVTGI